jgi:transposase
MMGHRQVDQASLFYEFSLERHVPADHLLRAIDRFVELGELRRELAAFYSAIGRPSVDPEPMMRMLIVGYCFGIRSERRLCEEIHLNLAYRWFCRLGLDGGVPNHSTSRRTGTAASDRAASSDGCLRRCCGAVSMRGWSVAKVFQVINQLLIRELFQTGATLSNCRKFQGAGTPGRTGGFLGRKNEPGVIK